jgi:phage baseplate assembly protein W
MASLTINLDMQNSPSSEYKYKDLGMPLKMDKSKYEFATLLDINSVVNGIKNIFTWSKGSRVLKPEFGNSLYQFIYEPINSVTAKNIGREVKEMIEKWEPRVIIDEVLITPFPDENQYDISVSYHIPTLKNKKINFTSILNRD